MGAIAVIECNAEQIKVEKTLDSNLSFVCATNTFHLPEMVGYNNDKIDNWFAEERYQTLYSAFSKKMEVSIFHLQKNCCLETVSYTHLDVYKRQPQPQPPTKWRGCWKRKPLLHRSRLIRREPGHGKAAMPGSMTAGTKIGSALAILNLILYKIICNFKGFYSSLCQCDL